MSVHTSRVSSFGFNTSVDEYVAVVSFTSSLAEGNYQLVSRQTIQDLNGRGLNSNTSGAGASNSMFDFSVATTASIGTQTLVNTYTTGNQNNSSVATDAVGDYVITWTSANEDGSGNGIYAQRYNATGVAQGSEFQVNTYTNGNQSFPKIAVDAAGDFVITWSSQAQDGSGYGIFAQRYNAAGVAQGGEFQVNTYTNGNQSNSSVAMDSAGDFVITWQGYGPGYGFQQIDARRYNASGVAQGGQFRVSTDAVTDTTPAIAMDATGDFVIAWNSDVVQSENGSDVYAQRFNSSGVAQGGEFLVNTYTLNYQNAPSVAMDATGDFVVTWNSYGEADPARQIFAQLYHANGTAQGSEFQVSTQLSETQKNSTVSMDAAGDFVVAWSNSYNPGLVGRRFNAAGVAQSAAFQINTTTTGNENNPSIAMDASGDFVVSWTGYTVALGQTDVYSQRYHADVAPYLSQIESTPLVVNGIQPTNVTSTLLAFDGTSTSATSATVTISSNYLNGQDQLIFTNMANITGSWNASNGTLSLTGTDSMANYQAALRSVQFQTANPYTIGRTISFQVTDGNLVGNTVTRTTTFGGPIVVSLVPISPNPSVTSTVQFSVTFSESVTGVTASDFTLAETGPSGGVITISGSGTTYTITVSGLVGIGTLGVNLTTFGSIVDAGNNSIPVGFTGSLLTLLALPTVTTPTSTNITASTATLGGDVTSDGGNSITARGILYSLTTINANPQIGGSGVINITASGTTGVFTTNVSSLTPGAVYSFVAYATNSGGTTYTSPVMTFTTTAVAPTLFGMEPISLVYSGTTAGSVTPTLAVTDLNFNAQIQTATIAITSGYQSATDSLLFTNTSTITGSWNSGTGTLTLSGADTPADYALALESIQFKNSGTNTSPRTISFTVIDGTNSSNTVTRIVEEPPRVLSINRTTPASSSTNANGVTFAATFSETVTGVDATDFALATTGTIAALPVVVTGSGSVYTLTVSGITGTGSVGVNLVDDGSIKNSAGLSLAQVIGPASFATQVTYATGFNPRSITMGDLTGNGILDLVVANEGSNSVSVFLGNGNGTFQTPQTFAVGIAPLSVTLGDLTGNGIPDIVVTSSGNNNVSILLGNGNGTFQPQQTCATGADPISVVLGDVNGDGKLDLAIANLINSSVSVLLGNGNGTFQTQQTFAAGTQLHALTLGDVNGDGNPDIIVSNTQDNNVGVLLGNGNGTFKAQQTFATGSGPVFATLGDVNGDGNTDLIVVNANSASVSVLLGNGNGTFRGQTLYSTGSQPLMVTLSDVNGDGNADIVVANTSSASVSVLLSNGNGTFQAQQTFATGNNPIYAAMGDLNGDGKSDIVTANIGSGTVSVLLVNRNGNFTGQVFTVDVASTVTTPTSTSILSTTATLGGNVTSDGGNTVSQRGVVYSLSTVNANPQIGGTGVINVTTSGTTGIFTIPVTGLAGGASYSFVAYATNSGGTTYTTPVSTFSTPLAVPALTNMEPIPLVYSGSAAVNVAPTLAVYDPNFGAVAQNATVAVTSGYQSVTDSLLFTNTSTITGTWNSGTGTLTLTGADTPADYALALESILFKNSGTNTSPRTILFTFYDGTNSSNTVTRIVEEPPRVLSINRTTPASSSTNANSVTFTATFSDAVTGVVAADFALVTTGNISASPVVVTSVSSSIYSLTVSGIKGDGSLGVNLVDNCSITNSAGLTLAQVSGPAGFAAQVTYATGSNPHSVAIGDLTGNGILDLVVANQSSNSVSVFLGNGNGTFQPQQTFATGSTPFSVTLGDLTGNGIPDIVVTNINSNSVSILLGNGNGTFLSQQTFATGSAPISVTLGDVNNDGKLDLAVANYNSSSVSVLPGNGNGTFQAQQTFAAGTNPESLTLGDVNGDGNPDIIVSNAQDNDVGVLLGNGNGTFKTQQTFATGLRPTFVTLGDVNGDGNTDLIVTNVNAASLSVLLGNGNGTFKVQTTYATGPSPFMATLSDLNGDGNADIIVSNASSTNVSVLLSNGNGTFQAQQTFATGSQPDYVEPGDLNGDGKSDIVVANFAGNTVSVLLGSGNGNFTGQAYSVAVVPTVTTPTSASITATTAILGGNVVSDSGDTITQRGVVYSLTSVNANPQIGGSGVTNVTSSGTMGVFTTNVSGLTPGASYSFVAYASNSGGSTYTTPVLTFTTSVVVPTLTGMEPVPLVYSGTTAVIVTPTLDVYDPNFSPLLQSATVAVTSGYQSAMDSLLFANTSTITGTWNSTTGTLTLTGTDTAANYTLALESVQFKNMGTNTVPRTISFTVNDGTNSSNTPTRVLDTPPRVLSINRNTPSNPTTANSVTYTATFSETVTGVDTGDFGLVTTGTIAASPVVVTGSGSVYTLTVNGITGNGTLGVNLVDNGSIKDSNGLTLAQQNGSARFSTQATFASGANVESVTMGDLTGNGIPDIVESNGLSNYVSVFLGNGNGTFKAPVTYATTSNPLSVTLSDLTGNGILDIVVVNSGHNVGILMGNGDGTFQAQQTFAAGPDPLRVAIANLANNGIPDFVVTDYIDNDVNVLLGNGNGTFQAPHSYATGAGSNPAALTLGDVNGDGNTDIVVANFSSNSVGVLLGNGNGTFQAEQTFATGVEPSGVTLGDVNGDGTTDIIVTNKSNNDVGVLLGNGNGTFQSQQTYATGSGPESIALADVNGDGNNDLVVGNSGGSSISVLLGNGNGTFATQQSFATGTAPYGLTLGDLNNDGKPDVVTVNNSSSTVSVLLGNGNGNFTGQVFTIDVAPTVTTPTSASITATNATLGGNVTSANGNAITVRGIVYSQTSLNSNPQIGGANVTNVTVSGTTGIFTTPLTGLIRATSYSFVAYATNSGGTTYTTPVSTFTTLALVPTITTPTSASITSSTATLGGNITDNGGSNVTASGVAYALTSVNPNPTIGGTGVTNLAGSGTAGNFTANASGLTSGASYSFVAYATNSVGTTYTTPVSTFSTPMVAPALTNVEPIPLVYSGSTAVNVAPTLAVFDPNFSPIVQSATVAVTSGYQSATDSLLFTNTSTISGSWNSVTGTLTLSGADTPVDYTLALESVQFKNTGTNTSPRTISFTINDGTTSSNAVTRVVEEPPRILSINRTTPASSSTNANSVTYTATFSEGVTGVVAADFALVTTGNIAASPLTVTTMTSSVYTITVSGITGTGSVGVNLVDNGSIKNSAGLALAKVSGPASFVTQVTYATGTAPRSVAKGDLTGNGILDLVVANTSSNSVSVFLGNGNGTFQTPQTFAAISGPFSITLGDLTGNGIPDIVVTNSGASNVGILLGNGNGTFQPQQTFATGGEPMSVVPFDVNADGKLDLVVANEFGPSISVLLGNGNGTFQTQQTYATGTQPDALTMGDVNGDGKPDIVVANSQDNDVGVLLGNGNGTFKAQQTFATGLHPTFVTLGDINGDGNTDLIVANSNAASVSVLLGNGNGTFKAQTTYATGSAPQTVTLGDVNGDGNADIVISNASSASVSVLLNNGNGTFQAQQTFATGSNPTYAALGDLNGDGEPDIVTSNVAGNTVSVLLSNGNGNFTGQVFTVDVTPTVTTPTSAAINATTATLGGNVTSDGGNTISQRGVAYSQTSVNSNPQIGGSGVTNITVSGTTGVFTTNISGLTPGASYSFVAYAINNGGATYTTPVSTFSAAALAPTVTTPKAASITTTTATLGGNITSNGGATVTASGVVYALTSINPNPTIGGTGVTNLTGSATTGVFTANASGVTQGAVYSFVAYATNSVGTTYTSPVSTFTPGPVTVTGVYDGSGNPVQAGSTLTSSVNSLSVAFSENMNAAAGGANSVVNPSNWLLLRYGTDVTGQISGITFSLNPTTLQYAAVVSLSSPLTQGGYQLIVRQNVQDVTGRALGGGSGSSGNDFRFNFNVATAVNGTTDIAPSLNNIEPTALNAVASLTTPITSSLYAYDADSSNWTGATVQIAINYQSGEDVLSFTNTATPNITAAWNATNGTLTLNGTDTVSDYRTALQNVTYHDTSATPNTASTRTVDFQASDGLLSSNVVTRDVTVMASSIPAVLSGVNGTGTFDEGDPALAIAANLVITDPNTVSLSSATVSFTNWQGEDRITFNNIFADQHTFTQDLVVHTAALTITGLDSVDHYQTLLRSVAYWDVSGAPVTTPRVASFTVSDGLSTSNAVTRNTIDAAVNQPPTLTAIETTPLAYKANDPAFPPQPISNTLLVGDPDSNNLTRATVQITSGYENDANGSDVLAFTNQLGITGSFNAATGMLTLSGTSSVSNYRTALRSVTFSTSGPAPGTANRTLTIYVNDDSSPTPATSLPTTRTVTVQTTNLPPAITGIPATSLSYVRGAAATAVAPAALVYDPDSINMASATIQITGNYQASLDVLAVTNLSGITQSFNASTGILTLSGISSIANYQKAIQSVTFSTTSSANTLSRTISLVINDGSANSTLVTRGVVISLTGSNTNPQISGNAVTSGSVSGAAGVLTPPVSGLTPGVSDSTSYATNSVGTTYTSPVSTFTPSLVTVTGVYDGSGNLVSAGSTLTSSVNSLSVAFSENMNAAAGGANSVVNPSNWLLLRYGTDVTGQISGITFSLNPTTLQYAAVVSLSSPLTQGGYQLIVRQNVQDVTGRALGGGSGSSGNDFRFNFNVATAVNGTTDIAPSLNNIEPTALNAVASLTTPITSSLYAYDADSSNWTGATVQIAINYQSSEDVLSFTNTATPNITAAWNATNGTLTLNGTDTVSDYRTALQNVTYHDTSATPNTASTRTVDFQASDGLLSSNVVTRDVTVMASSIPAVLSGVNGTGTFDEGDPALAIAANLVITDPNTVSLSSATVSFTNWQGEDRITFNNIFADQHTFTQDLVVHTAALTITGLDSVDHYQTLLRSVAYWDVSGAPVTTPRVASFTVSDGLSTSNAVTRNTIDAAVNQPPTLTAIETTPLAYKANDPAFPPQPISNTLLVGDPDSNNLTRATVQITSGYENDANGSDVLAFTNQLGITGSFNAATGMLTLSGTSSVSNYRTALRSVTFSTSGPAPGTANRTLTIYVNDDSSPTPATSLPTTRTVTVQTTNLPPAITGIPATSLSYVRGAAATAVAPAALVYDPDSINMASATIQITGNYQASLDVLAVTNLSGITQSFNASTGILTLSGISSIANYQKAIQSVTFSTTSSANTLSRTISLVINDGSANSTLVSRGLTLN